MKSTIINILKLTGKVIFILGALLNIGMVFFGFWPSLVYLLMMLLGAAIVYFTGKNVRYAGIRKLVTRTLIACLSVIVIIVLIFFLSENYFLKRGTVKECEEITAALGHYKARFNHYPANLSVLMEGNPLRGDWIRDEWESPYQYSLTNGGRSYLLKSSGQDRKPGTQDDIIFKGN